MAAEKLKVVLEKIGKRGQKARLVKLEAFKVEVERELKNQEVRRETFRTLKQNVSEFQKKLGDMLEVLPDRMEILYAVEMLISSRDDLRNLLSEANQALREQEKNANTRIKALVESLNEKTIGLETANRQVLLLSERAEERDLEDRSEAQRISNSEEVRAEVLVDGEE